MPYATLTIPYAQGAATASGDIWARLEQEYKEQSDTSATLGDLSEMLALAKTGTSAQAYVNRVCPYASVVGDAIVVELDFYVWAYDLGLQYELSAGIGTISAAEIIEEYKSFDIAFDNSDRESLGYLGEFALVPEMPHIKSDGELLEGVTIETDGSDAVQSATCTCVYRANGLAQGFKHTITMELVKYESEEDEAGTVTRTGYKIENLANTIVLSWQDENGELQTDTLELAIPPCVEDLLAECEDGKTVAWTSCIDRDECTDELVPVVYWFECNGEFLELRWEKDNG